MAGSGNGAGVDHRLAERRALAQAQLDEITRMIEFRTTMPPPGDESRSSRSR